MALSSGVAFAYWGDLDKSFKTGTVQTSFASLLRGNSTQGNGDIAQEVISLPGGDLFVAGTVDSTADGSSKQHGLARYKKDGCPVTTFGTGGIVATGDYFTEGGQTTVVAAARQSNGKIVVVGGPEFTIARYNDDGTYDESFGDDGMISYGTEPLPPTNQAGNSVVRHEDFSVSDVAIDEYEGGRRIVLVGSVKRQPYVWSDFWEDWTPSGTPNSDVALVVLNENGTPDATFGDSLPLHVKNRDGTIAATSAGTGRKLDLSSNDLGRGVAVDASRRIVVLARTVHKDGDTEVPSDQDFTVFRMTSGGALDTTWGTGGISTLQVSNFDEPDSVLIQSNGRIVIGGTYYTSSNTNNFMLAGFTSDTGVLDTTFSNDGFVEGDNYGTGGAQKAQATSLSLMSDDKLVIGGYTLSHTWATHDEFALAYYQANGTTVSGGRVQPRDNAPYPWERSYGATALADGRVVMVGGSGSASGDTQPLVNSKFHLVRLQGETPVASPALSLGDPAPTVEGDSGTTSVDVPITLSTASTCDVTFSYATDWGSTTGDDYTHITGTHTIPAGQTASNISVDIVGDTEEEGQEYFVLNASNLEYARGVDLTSEIFITDDDSGDPPPSNEPPVLDPVGDKTVAEGEELVIALSATDEDESSLTYEMTGDDVGDFTSDGILQFTPTYTQAGTYTVEFHAIDSELQTDSEEITITVTNVKLKTTTTVGITKTKDFIKVKGAVDPDNPGDEVAVKLFKKKDGKWKQVGKTKSPSLKDDSTYATKFPRPGKGSYKVTSKYLGDFDHKTSQATKQFTL